MQPRVPSPVSDPSGPECSFDNTRRVARAVDRFGAYARQLAHATRRGASPIGLVRTQFPFLLPDAAKPAFVTLELTNKCDLRCSYCENQLGLRAKGFMSEAVFGRVVDSVAELRVDRVRLVGNGEPTLHPRFCEYIERLVAVSPYVTVLSNGQWRSETMAERLLATGVAMIEFSVDGMDAPRYEASREGGSFDRLVRNLTHLRSLRSGHPALVRVRVMVRPSERHQIGEIRRFWARFADVVVSSPIVQRPQLSADPDVFTARQVAEGAYPRCTAPLIQLGVNWNGDVPLCSQSSIQIGAPGLVLGNIMDRSLTELWGHATRRGYCKAHRERNPQEMSICRGCMGH